MSISIDSCITGAIIPLRIRDNLNSFGDETFQGSLTFYVNRPKINIQHSVEVRDQESGMIASYWYDHYNWL